MSLLRMVALRGEDHFRSGGAMLSCRKSCKRILRSRRGKCAAGDDGGRSSARSGLSWAALLE